MEKWIAEIERIKMDTDSNLDRKCIGLNNVTIVFCDTKKQYNLTGNQFEDNHYFAQKGSCFDPFYAGCYVLPGEIIGKVSKSTIKKLRKSN